MKKTNYRSDFFLTNTLSNVVLLLAISSYSHATCNANVTPTVPNSRYQLLNNGDEVKDVQTGLIWQRCSVGQTWNGSNCIGTAATYSSWTNVLQTIANMGNGWRVPNIKELDSLIEQACYSPSINETYFPNTVSSYYWTSSPVSYNSKYAWIVSFNYGYEGSNGESNSNYVRLVRSSQ